MNLTEAIKEQAQNVGFSLVGVTTSDPLPHGELFNLWLNQGRQGEMGYLDSPHSRMCRADPQKILTECRSVLVVGIHYPASSFWNSEGMVHSELCGRVASYAWGEDYHDFLAARLQSLAHFIERQVGHPVPYRWYTDTGPILERELAQRAGLGWIGKNTCLINEEHGSYFLLGEILLGIELEPDQPFIADRCGKCTRCIFACPTGCILPDRTIDVRRCISYLTIELKGSIPMELRPQIDEWVFGCDICQQVCPWNRFAGSGVDPVFSQLLTQPEPELLNELALTSTEFNSKYRHSPLKRAKRRGYLRNIAVALGNSHRLEAVPALVRVLRMDGEPLVKAHAAWALGQIASADAKKGLEKATTEETDPMVKLEIQVALAHQD